MKVVAIVQARMGSTRLPNKVMRHISGIPMIELLLSRLAKAKEVDQIIVATSIDERNIPWSPMFVRLVMLASRAVKMTYWIVI